jgi:hypothetical protein
MGSSHGPRCLSPCLEPLLRSCRAGNEARNRESEPQRTNERSAAVPAAATHKPQKHGHVRDLALHRLLPLLGQARSVHWHIKYSPDRATLRLVRAIFEPRYSEGTGTP